MKPRRDHDDYDFAVLRGITSLSNYITSTIIKPAEVIVLHRSWVKISFYLFNSRW